MCVSNIIVILFVQKCHIEVNEYCETASEHDVYCVCMYMCILCTQADMQSLKAIEIVDMCITCIYTSIHVCVQFAMAVNTCIVILHM